MEVGLGWRQEDEAGVDNVGQLVSLWEILRRKLLRSQSGGGAGVGGVSSGQWREVFFLLSVHRPPGARAKVGVICGKRDPVPCEVQVAHHQV